MFLKFTDFKNIDGPIKFIEILINLTKQNKIFWDQGENPSTKFFKIENPNIIVMVTYPIISETKYFILNIFDKQLELLTMQNNPQDELFPCFIKLKNEINNQMNVRSGVRLEKFFKNLTEMEKE